MTLDELGMSPAEFLPWVVVVVGFSVIALILVLRRENNGLARVLWLLLIVCVPILAPFAALLFYMLWKPAQSKEKRQAK